MPKVTVLPHAALCSAGAEIVAQEGETLCNVLLANGIAIEHACEKSCACTTCHVVVRDGFGALAPAEEKEEDMLDKAWGLEGTSRLACQARMPATDLVIEIPKYTINYEREGGGH
jgi:2Fe-2S ferredoxin